MAQDLEVAASDLMWMDRALALAARGRFTTAPNPNVGCVLIRDGELVGEGWIKKPVSLMPKCTHYGLRVSKHGVRRPT